MASETSDLTFVRCPSCRSLVPASATRCRICNNPLDALHADEGEEAKQGGGRVRQKTITASPQEVEAAIQAAQAARPAPPPPPPPQRPAAAAPAPQDPADDLDPLGAYLQEIESGGAALDASAGESSQAASPMPAADDDDDLFDLDIFDDPADEPPARKPQAVREAEPVRAELPLDEPAPAPEPAPEPPPRRPIEAAPRPAERPRPAAPPQQARPAAAEPRRNEGRPQQDQQRGQQRSDRMQEQRQAKPAPAPQQRAPEPNKQRRDDRDNRRQDRPPRQEPPRREHERREEMSERAPVTGPKTGKMRPGRLFGWLVSYESPDGRAIELREGKFFVTASSIKGSDLVLEDPSISTPHALMSISESGLLVQDLMSDNGVFVRTEGDGDYRREDGIIRVAHGDWIRFGDVEFLVIVVPSSAK